MNVVCHSSLYTFTSLTVRGTLNFHWLSVSLSPSSFYSCDWPTFTQTYLYNQQIPSSQLFQRPPEPDHHSEYGGSMFLWNTGTHFNYTLKHWNTFQLHSETLEHISTTLWNTGTHFNYTLKHWNTFQLHSVKTQKNSHYLNLFAAAF